VVPHRHSASIEYSPQSVTRGDTETYRASERDRAQVTMTNGRNGDFGRILTRRRRIKNSVSLSPAIKYSPSYTPNRPGRRVDDVCIVHNTTQPTWLRQHTAGVIVRLQHGDGQS